jgi:hypothetical protein
VGTELIASANALKLSFTWLELMVVLGWKVFGTFTGAYEVTGTTKKAKTNDSTRCLNEDRFLLKYDMVVPRYNLSKINVIIKKESTLRES